MDHVIASNGLVNEEPQPFTGTKEVVRRRLHPVRSSQITKSSVKKVHPIRVSQITESFVRRPGIVWYNASNLVLTYSKWLC